MQATFPNDKRKQQMVTLTLDAESQRKLQELADASDTAPGNKSQVIRELISRAYKNLAKGKAK